MKKKIERKGKQRIPVIDNLIYSNLIFQISMGNNYAQKIFEATKKPTSIIVRQLDILKKEGFVSVEYIEDKSIFPMQRLTLYSVKWERVVEEFLKYIKENIDYVCSENERLGLKLDNIIKGFNERVNQAKDKKFQEDLKKNIFLQTFFKNYYAEIGRLKENWTITATFDFLSFFGDLNFIYQWSSSHEFYNIEKVFYILNQSESSFPEWLLNEKKPTNEEEEFERFKKIHKHTTTEQDNLEKKRKRQLDDFLEKNKELVELYILDRILQVIKIKPSLQLGLNNAIRQTGKEIFKRTLDKEQIKSYFDLRTKYNLFSIDRGIIEEDLKEITGENYLKTTKPIENKHKKSGNTNQNKALSSENKQGESSK